MDHVCLDYEVIADEVCGVGKVGVNATDFGGSEETRVGRSVAKNMPTSA